MRRADSLGDVDRTEQSTTERPRLVDRLEPWLWRPAAAAAWCWGLDAISLKIRSVPLFGVSNWWLVLVPVSFVWHWRVRRKQTEAFWLLAYIVVFPLWLPLVVGSWLIAILVFFQRRLHVSTRTLAFMMGPGGVTLLLASLVIVQVCIVVFSPIAAPILAWLSVVTTLLLVLLTLRYVLNPLGPVRTLKRAIGATINTATEWSCRIVCHGFENAPSEKLERALGTVDDLRHVIDLIQRKLTARLRISERQFAIPVFLFGVLALLGVIVVGFGGAYYALNSSSQYGPLFGNLPPGSGYGNHLFYSFTVMTMTQTVTIDNSSRLGKILTIVEFTAAFFAASVFCSIFLSFLMRSGQAGTPPVTARAMATAVAWKGKVKATIAKGESGHEGDE